MRAEPTVSRAPHSVNKPQNNNTAGLTLCGLLSGFLLSRSRLRSMSTAAHVSTENGYNPIQTGYSVHFPQGIESHYEFTWKQVLGLIFMIRTRVLCPYLTTKLHLGWGKQTSFFWTKQHSGFCLHFSVLKLVLKSC